MTSAARPTFDPARGGKKDLNSISKQYATAALPSHTKLKFREPGQGTTDEFKEKDYRRDLEDKERQVRKEKDGSRNRSSASDDSRAAIQPPAKKSKIDPANLDADDPVDDSDADSAEDDSDDEDDTAALMAELQRIKKERAAEQAKKESEKRAEEERIRAENILSGNPLLSYTATAKSDMKVKRRWDEDVIFKNCARVDDATKVKGFVNDCLRSDFHRKFMEKYIK